LNTRVDQYNQASQDFAKRKQEYDSRAILNQRDAQDWLGRARSFIASDAFNAFLVKAGSPAVCTSEPIAEPAELSGLKAVTQAQGCLKAVKAGVT
jgi:hypothetical protein